jgi:hypothetical protein
MANSNANIKYLNQYLNQQLDSTYDEIREVESRLHTNTTAVNQQIEVLNYRKAFLLTQLDNLQYQLTLNK